MYQENIEIPLEARFGFLHSAIFHLKAVESNLNITVEVFHPEGVFVFSEDSDQNQVTVFIEKLRPFIENFRQNFLEIFKRFYSLYSLFFTGFGV